MRAQPARRRRRGRWARRCGWSARGSGSTATGSQEAQVADDLLRRSADRPDDLDLDRARAPTSTTCSRRRTSRPAARDRRSPRCRGSSVIAGGPGTGKTTTVARLLTVLRRQRPGAAHRAGRADRQGRGPAGGGGARRRRAADRDRPRTRSATLSRRRPCTGCSAGGPASRAGSGTTATTGCPSTSWSSTRARWCR